MSSQTTAPGVLLVNLGTPVAPTAGAIRSYLREFLSDPRVVELPRLVWLPLLYGVILPFRPQKLVGAYAKVWTVGGSPLLAWSRKQQQALQAALGPGARVALAMRYGSPSLADGLADLERAGVTRVLVLPLYPQYSATTTASVFDAVFAQLAQRRRWPDVRTLGDYHDDPGYIDALAASVTRHWQAHGRGERLLVSFHSIPQRCVDLGDPYEQQCRGTAQLLAARLGLGTEQWSLSYQSRLGRAQWLQPYTEEEVVRLGTAGVRTLDVICPGFPADCLETLEEIAIRYAGRFAETGGALRYVPALNDDAEHVAALAGLVRRQLSGWSALG